MRFAIDVGADIQKDGWLSFLCWQHRRKCRPIDYRQSAQNHFHAGHHRASISGADDTRNAGIAHEPGRDANRRISLFARGCCGRFFHSDDLAGMDNFDGQIGSVMPPQLIVNTIFPPNQHDGNSVLGGSLNSAIDLDCGRLIAAHRIDRDFDFGHEELFLSSLDNLRLLVVAAVRTGPMRHPQLVAIGAFREGSRRQMIVRPPAVAPRLRMSSFWVWHTLTPAWDDMKIPLSVRERHRCASFYELRLSSRRLISSK